MRVSRAFQLLSLFLLGGLMLAGLGGLRPFGEPADSRMDDYFIAHAQAERATNNVVTSIVFDYRGFDTLGEAAVLFTAVCSVLALFRGGVRG